MKGEKNNLENRKQNYTGTKKQIFIMSSLCFNNVLSLKTQIFKIAIFNFQNKLTLINDINKRLCFLKKYLDS
jgi:hypothetical protein